MLLKQQGDDPTPSTQKESRTMIENQIFKLAVMDPMGAKKMKQDFWGSRCVDDLLARRGQPGQRQNWSRFARRRVQRRFLEPEVELAPAAVTWERPGWRLAFRAVC